MAKKLVGIIIDNHGNTIQSARTNQYSPKAQGYNIITNARTYGVLSYLKKADDWGVATVSGKQSKTCKT